MKWNDIPYDENATPETKALEFDLQHAENKISADHKRAIGEYPYDLDGTNE